VLLAVVVAGGCGSDGPAAGGAAGDGAGDGAGNGAPGRGIEVVDERVQVEVERTGGFGGLVTHRSADTAALPPDEARELRDLVGGLDVEALGRAPASTRSVPDAFEYDVVISTGGRSVRLHAQDPDVPEQLRPLIRFVIQRT
jgi:hypothetical protein